jgi:hypothetical protein
MGPAMREVMAAVAAQGVGPAGPVFSHHFRMDPDVFDFEVGVPVTAPVSPAGRVQPGQLPAVRVSATWGELGAWIAANGHTPASKLWECYITGPESSADPAGLRTELNQPLIG